MQVLTMAEDAGEIDAFERIVRAYQRQVLGTAWRLLGNAEDARDAAQEVFVRLYRHRRRFEEGRNFSAWLYRIVVNVCRDMARRRRPAAPLEDLPSGEPGPLAALLEEERQRLIVSALRLLPEKERAALVLRDLEGLPTEEVARILGSSPATVRSQVASARLKIRDYVERLGKRRAR